MARNFICNICDGDDLKNSFHVAKQLIAHYQKEHPDSAVNLFDAIGETWDPQLTGAFRANQELKKELREAKDKNERLFTEHRDAVAKLNAVILILRQ